MTTSDIAAVISAVSALGSLFVVSIGAWVAYSQLTAWRSEAVGKRRADVAERALIAIAKVDDAMRFIRSQHSRVPVEIADREATYLKLRQQRIADSNALFVELQDCQVAVYIQLGWDGVDELFNEILELRSEVVLAIDNMCGSIDDDTIEARRLKIEWRKIYSGDYSANDELGMKQQKAIKLLQQKLFPVARHNAGKN